jgi:hypothetical protein
VAASGNRVKRYVKTIAFFRLLAAPDGGAKEQVQWSERLANVSDDTRLRVARQTGIDGSIVQHDGVTRLVLSRDRGNAPRQQDTTTGAKSAMRTRGAGWNVIEEGFVTFLGLGNVFAYARSSSIAPSSSAVGEWLNSAGLTPTVTWIVDPLVDPDRYHRIEREGGVTMLDIKARPALAPDDSDNSLIRSVLGLRELGDVKIEIKVSVTRGGRNSTQQRALRQQALEVLGFIAENPYVVEGAKVKMLGDPDPIDLIEHHITSKRTVEIALGERNRSLNEEIVFQASDGVIAENMHAIQRIIGQ